MSADAGSRARAEPQGAGQGRAEPAAIAASPAPPLPQCTRSRTHTDRHIDTRGHRLSRGERAPAHGPAPARTAAAPPEPTYPRVTSHSPARLPLPPLLCAPASAAAERPHMSANTSRQKAASAEQRQPGLPSSQHKAARSYFQACSLSPSEGTLLCFSLSLSPLCLSSYCTTRINYSLLVSRFPGKTNHRWSLANGLMPYLPTGYLCSSYNPLETIKRIRLSFKTSHVREQT